MYYARYTEGNKTNTEITRRQLGTTPTLDFTVYDEDGDVVNLTSLTTNMKIYVGSLTALQITGGTLVDNTVASGKVKYVLLSTDFDAEIDAGTYDVELQFADNATIGSATSVIRAGGLRLTVKDTISD